MENNIEKSNIERRPKAITFICLFFGLINGFELIITYLGLALMPEIRNKVFQEYGTTESVINIIGFTLSLVGLIGYWRMRRWGVYLFSAIFICGILTDLIFNTPIEPLYVLINLAIIGFGLKYFKQMG